MFSNKRLLAGQVPWLTFYLHRLRERLWFKPLVVCILSTVLVLLAGQIDESIGAERVPDISRDTIETLLSILSASMLMMATFAVGAMLSAYVSASNAATPRAFAVVVADDVSQNALSVFLGAFIFSVVALIALLNDYYHQSGRFYLFLLTLVVLVLVVGSFVRWMDRIARLGRTATIISRVETITAQALERARQSPTLGGVPLITTPEGTAVYGQREGYVQRVNVHELQKLAEHRDCRLALLARPGIFASAGQPLVIVEGDCDETLEKSIVRAFVIADHRTFEEDPRFGLVVLAEIASRALPPGINDPGTAIHIIGSLIRLLSGWARTEMITEVEYDRVQVPPVAVEDMLDDAFGAIARDGRDLLEVAIRLQKGLYALSCLGDEVLTRASRFQALYALKHAQALSLPEDLERVEHVARWATNDSSPDSAAL